MLFFRWSSVFFALSILPLAMLDPVISGFALLGAIVAAGISGLCIRGSSRFSLAIILISLVSAVVLSSYSPAGLRMPTASSLFNLGTLLIIPLTAALLLIGFGQIRRRKKRLRDIGR